MSRRRQFVRLRVRLGVALAITAPLAFAQEPSAWSERAVELELDGQPDHAAMARIRGLVESDFRAERSELARLVEPFERLQWTRRLTRFDGSIEAPGIATAPGIVATALDTVSVWDERTGERVAGPFSSNAWGVSLDPTGTTAAVLRRDDTAELWRVATGERIAKLQQSSGRCRWSEDGRLFALAFDSADGPRFDVLDAATGERLFRSPLHPGGWSFALSSRGWLALDHGDEEGTVIDVYDVATGGRIAAAIPGGYSSLRFHSVKPWLLFHGRGGALRVYDVEAGVVDETHLVDHPHAVVVASDSAGDRWVAGFSDECVATRIDGTPAGKPLVLDDLLDRGRFKYGRESSALATDGSLYACSGVGDSTRLWDTRTGERLGPVLRHGARVWRVRFTPSGSLVTASRDGVVRVWSTEGMRPVEVLADPYSLDVHFPRTGSRAIVVREVGAVERLDASGRALQHVATQERLHGLVVSRDGAYYAGLGGASGAWRGPLRGDWEPPRRISAASNPWPLALDADGARLAEKGDGALRVWDPESGDLLEQYPEVTGSPTRLAFDPDGRLLSMAYDGLLATRREPERRTQGREWIASDGFYAELDVFGEAYLTHNKFDTDTTWHCGAEVVRDLEQWTAESRLRQVYDWKCTRTRVAAIHAGGATLIDPRAGRVVATCEASDVREVDRAILIGDRLLLDLDGALELFDANNGARLASFEVTPRILSAIPLPGTAEVLVSVELHSLEVRDILTGDVVGSPMLLDRPPRCVDVDESGYALVGTGSGAVYELDLSKGSAREVVPAGTARTIHLERSPDGRRAVRVEEPDVAVLWDLVSGAELHRRKLTERTSALFLHGTGLGGERCVMGFDPTGERLLVAAAFDVQVEGGSNHEPVEAQIVDARTGEVVCSLDRSDGRIERAQFSADGALLVAWEFKRADIWDTGTGERVARVEMDERIRVARFQGGGERLCTVQDDGAFAVWESRSGLALRPASSPAVEGNSYPTISPDGRLIAVPLRDRGVRWIDVEAEPGTGSRDLLGHGEDAVFGPDGAVLVGRNWLGRRTHEGVVGVQRRPKVASSFHWHHFAGRRDVCFVDTERIAVGARPVPDGVEFLVLDFGPSRFPPMDGVPAALEEKWGRRLGLDVDSGGRIVRR